MAQSTRDQNVRPAPPGDASQYPADIPKGKGPVENNKDYGAVNVNVQTADRNPFVESARVMPRRRSKAIEEKSAPFQRRETFEEEVPEMDLALILQMILGQR